MRSAQRRMAAIVAAGALALAGCGGGDDAEPVAVGSPETSAPTAEASSTPSATPSPTRPALPVGIQVRNQQLLDEVAAQVPQGKDGFARIVTDVTTLSMTIYWKGEPPPSVQELEGTTDSGVDVEVEKASVSKDDLDDALKRIIDAAKAGQVPEPESITVNDDHDGLTIGFLKAHFDANTTDAMREKYRMIAKLPVHFIVAQKHALD